MFPLVDERRVAIITGGSSGIGLEAGRQLAATGHDVVLTARREGPLREAAEAGRSVFIGYVDHHGSATERVVDPVSVEGGQLTAFDHRADDHRTFALHRITVVRPLT